MKNKKAVGPVNWAHSEGRRSLQPPSLRMCLSFLQQSDYPYNENVPSIKIPMDMMEQEPFLGDKASDSE